MKINLAAMLSTKSHKINICPCHLLNEKNAVEKKYFAHEKFKIASEKYIVSSKL